MLRRRSARTRGRAINATAASTGSGTRSCASTGTGSRRRLALCRALGPKAAADCAQGAYHDYWFAAVGADGARLPKRSPTDPRTLCAAQPRAFVRPCWYAPSSTTVPPASRLRRRTISMRSAAGSRASSVSVRNRRLRDRASGRPTSFGSAPSSASRQMPKAASAGPGSKPPGAADRYVRGLDPSL